MLSPLLQVCGSPQVAPSALYGYANICAGWRQLVAPHHPSGSIGGTEARRHTCGDLRTRRQKQKFYSSLTASAAWLHRVFVQL